MDGKEADRWRNLRSETSFRTGASDMLLEMDGAEVDDSLECPYATGMYTADVCIHTFDVDQSRPRQQMVLVAGDLDGEYDC